jgi:hypothetical protein
VAVKPLVRLDNPLAKWEVNHLTPAGHRALTDYRARFDLAPLPYTNPADLTYQTVTPHSMGITSAVISAYAGAPEHGLTIETYLDDRAIRSLSKQGKIHWPMEPDFLLILRMGELRQVLFGEFDNGTESIDSPRANSLSTKYDNYRTYYASQRRDDPWLKHYPQPQTMFIFDSQIRLENARQMVGNRGGKSAYWFALAQHMEGELGFLEAVWQRIGLEGWRTPTELFTSY